MSERDTSASAWRLAPICVLFRVRSRTASSANFADLSLPPRLATRPNCSWGGFVTMITGEASYGQFKQTHSHVRRETLGSSAAAHVPPTGAREKWNPGSRRAWGGWVCHKCLSVPGAVGAKHRLKRTVTRMMEDEEGDRVQNDDRDGDADDLTNTNLAGMFHEATNSPGTTSSRRIEGEKVGSMIDTGWRDGWPVSGLPVASATLGYGQIRATHSNVVTWPSLPRDDTHTLHKSRGKMPANASRNVLMKHPPRMLTSPRVVWVLLSGPSGEDLPKPDGPSGVEKKINQGNVTGEQSCCWAMCPSGWLSSWPG
ncbi:hypothetical protein BC826DRAFT_972361 [Russula brevipes]|nr:hypothetical protein BC826DRAFT_972361 [Russula brevipes]